MLRSLDAIWCHIFCNFKKKYCKLSTFFTEGRNKGLLFLSRVGGSTYWGGFTPTPRPPCFLRLCLYESNIQLWLFITPNLWVKIILTFCTIAYNTDVAISKFIFLSHETRVRELRAFLCADHITSTVCYVVLQDNECRDNYKTCLTWKRQRHWGI